MEIKLLIKLEFVGVLMNKEWSELNKEVKILLNKRTSFKDGVDKLIALRSFLFNGAK